MKSRKMKKDWVRFVTLALIVEKILQHVTVTTAFYFQWDGIKSLVVVDANILLVLSGIAAILFCVGLWGMVSRQKWAAGLVIGLALFDLVGEFVAQGKITIVITVSFLVAAILLALALIYRSRPLFWDKILANDSARGGKS